MDRNSLNKIGEYSYISGIILSYGAIFIREFIPPGIIILAIFILGLIVGFLNVSRENTSDFLLGSITLILLALAGFNISSTIQLEVVEYLDDIFRNFLIFIGSASLVVARKAIFSSVKHSRGE